MRQCSAEMGLSISSVIRGYELLQDQMLIEPRPQSGFYVRPQFERNNSPDISRPVAETAEVNINSLAVTLLQTTRMKMLYSWVQHHLLPMCLQ